MRELSQRRQKFIAAHAAGMSLSDAAVVAGFSVRSATAYGSLLMKNPGVAAAVQAERARLAANKNVTTRYDLARVMKDIDESIDVARATNDAGSMAALVRTRLELLGMVSR